MATVDSVNFNINSILGQFDNRWVITGGGYIDEANNLVLQPGGSASLTLTSQVNIEFKYLRIVARFYSSTLSAINNFNSALSSIRLEEIYKDGSGAIYKQRYRTLGFNTTNPDATTGYYFDEEILTMLDKKMASFRVTINNVNNTANLVLSSLSMFTSIDVSESQVSTITQDTLNKQSAAVFKFYRDETDSSIKGVGVFVDGSSSEIKMRPDFFNGILVSVSTNYGQSISVINTTDEIDLET